MKSFQAWPEVIAHVKAGLPLFYQAPMDRYPVSIRAKVRGSTLRVHPPTSAADAFTADEKHLDRMRFDLCEKCGKSITVAYNTLCDACFSDAQGAV